MVIDHSESQLPPDELGNPFSTGSQVYHPKFGSGTVHHCSGVGPFSRVTVRFPDFGVKKIVAKYLQAL